MRRTVALLPHLASALVSWYALAAFLMIAAGLSVHDSVGRGWAVWLGWPLAVTTGSMAGTRLWLMSDSRLPRLWPKGWPALGRALILLLFIGCVPGWLLAPGTPPVAPLVTSTAALALLGLAIGMRFGVNGIMWLAMSFLVADILIPINVVAWLLDPVNGGVVLAVTGLLAWSGWRACIRRHSGRDRLPGRLRLLLRDRPGQPLGWRLLLAYLVFGLLVILVPLVARTGWANPGDVSQFRDLAWSTAFIGAILLSVTAAHELFNFRAALRLYFLLPGHDRDCLRLRAAIGLFRAWIMFGVIPHIGLVVLATRIDDVSAVQVMLVALMIITVLVALASLVLRLVAVPSHAGAVASLVGLTLLVILLAPAWRLLWQIAESGPLTMLVILLATSVAVVSWVWARAAWRALSLQRIAHWPLIKLARESSFG